MEEPKTAKYWVAVAKTGLTGLEEIFQTAMDKSYNQCLFDLINDDLLPDKELNLNKYIKKPINNK